MKVLLINDFWMKFWWAETVVRNTRNLLEKNWHFVAFFSWWEKNVNLLSFITRYFSIIYFVKIFIFLLMSEEKFDIAHIHGLSRKLSPSILIPLRLFWIKIIYTLHDYHYYCPKTRWIFEDGKACEIWFNQRCWLYNCYHPNSSKTYHFIKRIKVYIHRFFIIKFVDRYIVLNSHMKKVMSRSLSIKESRLYLLPNFYSWYNVDRKSITKTKTFLFVWRISREKGIDVTIRAIKIITDQWYTWFHFNVIWDWPDLPRLESLVEKLEIKEYVNFLWRIENSKLWIHYSWSLAVIISSVWLENNPLVALEAMWNSVPIIASKIWWLPDLVEDWKSWYLFQLRDHMALSKIMLLFLDNESRSVDMWRKWNEILIRKFNKEDYFENLMNIYNFS